ncbi:MAG: hypothetical protein H0U73_04115 [Tatlockia sp.]|nr:hypothetical protein [Tatlockia sp.]
MNIIFSLGYPELKNSHGFLPISLFWLGQLATYTIGYPLGFIFGGLAACMVVFINLFRTEKGNNRLSQSGQIEKDNFQELNNSLPTDRSHDLTTKAKTVQTLICSKSEKEQSLDMHAIELVNCNKRKDQLIDKISKVGQVIETEIAFLNSSCTVYENQLKKYHDLNATLRSKTYLAENAKKFSHNQINTTLVPSCFLIKLGKINTYKTTLAPLSQSIPVYVPDEAQRNLAKKECESLNKEIKELGTVSHNKPIQFSKRESLGSISDDLKTLQSLVKYAKNEIALSHGIKGYKEYLKKLDSLLFKGTQYNKINYLPICDYSELMFASLMVNQLTKGNDFFKNLPRELNEKIIFHAVSDPSFSEKDAKKISNTFTNFFKCKEKQNFIDTSANTLSLTY